MRFNIIIPMAGESSRFNYNFKPFIKLDNRTFLEHCLSAFLKYDYVIESYNFVVTKEQEEKYGIENKLKTNLFSKYSSKINVFSLPEKTSGLYQSVYNIFAYYSHINKYKYEQKFTNMILCDCDHHINVEPIIKYLLNNQSPDILIPIWKIDDNEHQNWGKVILEKNTNKIIRFCEKEYVKPELDKTVNGLIGCYYIKNPDLLTKNENYLNMSDFLEEQHKELNIKFQFIKNAYFFGTPEMVENCINQRRKYETILCDVDGVLLKHNPHSNDNLEDNILLGDCVSKLKRWKDENKMIILVTARPKESYDSFTRLLKELDIVYDEIVMGLNPGPRYLINDIKPSNIFVKQAVAFNLTRDDGIDNLNCCESDNYKINILKIFKGNSFSSTYLLKKENTTFVRKYIKKFPKTLEHCERLKRQCEDLKRFRYYDKNLVPKILNECDTLYDYYLDLEYLSNHKQLDEFNIGIQHKVLHTLLERLASNVYCYKKRNNSIDFIEDFFNTKIYPKLKEFEKECDVMSYLINTDTVKINDKSYYGLRKIFNLLNIHNFNSEWINPIHGDLTLENILYNEKNEDIKLIDMEGSRYVDSCYFDLGKIFQSIVSNYKEWNDLKVVVYDKTLNNIKCVDKYFDCENSDYDTICNLFCKIMEVNDKKVIFKKGIFFMATYFIRFVQFRRKISEEHGIFAIIMAIVWLNKIL
tara:strand:+ start:1919 stop:4009 length:2091 start_codon:yes stop_codon:yes gene_type:complete